jgi:hypothetical protein
MGCDKLDMIELQTKKCFTANTNEKITGNIHNQSVFWRLTEESGCYCFDITEKYKCLGWWEAANGENYLVVSSAGHNSSPGGHKNTALRNYEKRSCFVFYETTPSQTQELSSLSLLHSTSHGRRNQEINLEENGDDDDKDNENDDAEERSFGRQDQDKESQQKRNLKRQFHFVRFEESCERRASPQRRKLADDELRIGLVFNASTSYYYGRLFSH